MSQSQRKMMCTFISDIIACNFDVFECLDFQEEIILNIGENKSVSLTVVLFSST